MEVASDVGSFLIRSIFTLFLMLVLLRVMLQVARADFYNPLSQAIVKITNPVLMPLRKIIPGLGGLDLAGIVLALLVQIACIVLLYSMKAGSFPPIANTIAWAGLGIISLMLTIYWVAVLVGIIASFLAPGNNHPLLLLLHQFTEPVLAPFRRILPAIGGLDLSPILFFLLLGVLQILVGSAAQAVRMPAGIVPGF